MRSPKHLFLITCSAIIVVGILILGYFAFLDGTYINPVIKFNDGLTFETEKLIYRPGDTVRAQFNFCKMRPIVPKTQWTLVDTYIKAYPIKEVGMVDKGCYYTQYFVVEPIPRDTIDGKYYFSGTFTYHVNGLRDVVYEVRTNEIQVTK